ncbi:hypothetical protein CCACVL1_30750 [Corchorus capsularis]|uniref:Uncharacterized protein n=1 Tax=Corchorus capsularis TaxID=210143 RepID=A0A1R3FVP0_COCAP|nr:hypothetical protein CCACVL1_30750 [Corchorus capsularis]
MAPFSLNMASPLVAGALRGCPRFAAESC